MEPVPKKAADHLVASIKRFRPVVSAVKRVQAKIVETRPINGKQSLLLVMALIIGTIYSALIPPFQSPDELSHITRAYSLLTAEILLDEHTGVHIDRGLLKYMQNYEGIPFWPERKVTNKLFNDGKDIHWAFSDDVIFTSAASYFPFAYFPQAVGLWIGKLLDTSVDTAYRLARFFVLLASLLALFFAFKVFPPNFFVLAMLLLPMSLFQMVATSLDAFSNALAVLCISLFMRGANVKYTFPTWMGLLLPILIFITASCRAHLLPFVIFPLIVFLVRKQNRDRETFLWSTACCILWILISSKTGTIPTPTDSPGLAVTARFYLTNPSLLVTMIKETFSKQPVYFESFIGILGWLDACFPPRFYCIAGWFLATTACLSISLKTIKADLISRISLVFVALSSTALIILILLLAGTSQSAPFIEGIQGRYFLIPMILFGYSLNGTKDVMKTKRALPTYSILSVWLLIVAYSMTQLLIVRYYLSP